MTVSISGKICIFIGFLVLLTGLFVSMSTLVGLFLIFAGIITMIQGNNMKVQEPQQLTRFQAPEPKDTTRTYTFGASKNTKGVLSNIQVKNKGAV